MIRLLIFFLLNFGALALGGMFTGSGVPSAWYQQLNKAPWTPPGWVFGAAWTTIMMCFSVLMFQLTREQERWWPLLGIYALQWILNVSWNPLFFAWHYTGWALVCIVSLLFCVCAFFLFTRNLTQVLLLAPYAIWLCIACSLNAYILIKN
jgi:tryptophan-rich sensory protein